MWNFSAVECEKEITGNLRNVPNLIFHKFPLDNFLHSAKYPRPYMTANSQQKYSIKNGAQLRSLKLDFPSRCFSKPLTTERKYDLDMRGYESTRHTVNSSLVNSSHTRLITQSTRHKRAHNKTTSTSRNYLHAVRRHPETVLMLNNDGVITAICVTLMYTADYRSQQQITLIQKARSTRHNAEKHDGQLVTRFYGVTS